MSEPRLIDPLPADAPDELDTPTVRDVQRDALEDLLQLSRECSAHEAELEARHTQTQADSKTKLDKALLGAEMRLDSLRKQADAASAEARKRLETDYRHELARLKEHAHHRRVVANAAYDATKADVKKKFDHATWLADSVLEAAEVKANGEYRAEVEKGAEQADQLSVMEAEAATLVMRYGQTPEPVEDKPAAPGPLDVQAYYDRRAEADRLLTALNRLGVARLFTGVTPVLIVALLSGGVAAAVYAVQGSAATPDWQKIGYAGGGRSSASQRSSSP